MRRSAGITLSRLSIGSPMPMSTTLVTGRAPPSSRFASQSCPTISPVLRLRLKPCLPVEQKAQSSVQPAWLDTHSVPRPVSGMNTASTALAASTLSNHLRVPSSATWSPTIRGARTSAAAASLTRSSLARSLMRANSDSRRWCTHCITWRARNGFSPSVWKNAARPAASRPRRLVFMSAREHLAGREEVRDLGARGLRAIRAVHRVGVDRFGEVRADGARGGLLRVGGAHQLAVLRDRILAFQHLHEHWAGNHELHQVAEERPLAMHRVEALGLRARQMHHARGGDAQPRSFEARDDLADRVLLHCVRLDDGQGPLDRHSRISMDCLKS